MNGAGAGVGAGAGSIAQAAARAAAAAAGAAIGSAAAEVRAAIDVMVDEGLLRHADDDLAYCPRNHSFDARRGRCPKCASEPDDPPSTDAILSADDELLRSEDRQVLDGEDDRWAVAADEPGFLEQLELALSEAGCSHAQGIATEVASLWKPGEEADLVPLRTLAQTRGWSEATLVSIEAAFRALARAEAPNPTSPANSSPSADIRIWRAKSGLRWQVVDHLAGFFSTGRSGIVRLGDVRYSVQRAAELLRERGERLEALARELTRARCAFFDERDPVKAMAVLGKQPLTQKEVCDATGIPPTAMSRWCDYKGRSRRKTQGRTGGQTRDASMRTGVEIETPHGVFPLAAFFSAPARAKGGRGRTQELFEEDVEQVIAKAVDEGLDRSELVTLLQTQYGIDLAERTVRKYRKKAKGSA